MATVEMIAHAVCVGRFQSTDDQRAKFEDEAWICTFSPDETHFAWSRGKCEVTIVPWDRKLSWLKKTVDGNDQSADSYLTFHTNCEVWALAFGLGRPELATDRSHWTRFNFGRDLMLAAGLSNGRIRIYGAATGKLLNELIDHKNIVSHLSFAPDGSLRLVSASRDCTLKVWDMKDDGNMFKTLRAHTKWVASCAWSPNCSLLASVGSGKAVFLWDMTTYQLHRQLNGHMHDVVSCDFSPDGALLATAGLDTRVFLWNPHTGHVVRSFGHLFPPPRTIFASGANGNWVRAVSFAPNGCHLTSVADDGFLRLWNVCNNLVPEAIAVVSNAICCSYSPSGQVIAVGDKYGSVSLWTVPTKPASLQHICRTAINRHFPNSSLSEVTVPSKLISYLRYED